MKKKWVFFKISLLLIPLLFLGTLPTYGEIVWEESFKKGIEQAKLRNSPVVIDFYTDWCGYCKVLENKIFPDPEVSKLLENFTTLRINGEEYPDIAGNFKVSGYPTVLFLDKNGAYLDRIVGLPSSPMMAKKLKEVYEKRNIEDQFLNIAKQDPDSVLNNYKLGIYYFKANQFEKSEGYFLKSIQSPKTDHPEKKMESLFILGIIQIQEKRYSQAISIWSRYLTEYPNGDEFSARYYRGVSYFYYGKYPEAKDDFLRAKILTTDGIRRAKIQEFLDKIDL